MSLVTTAFMKTYSTLAASAAESNMMRNMNGIAKNANNALSFSGNLGKLHAKENAMMSNMLTNQTLYKIHSQIAESLKEKEKKDKGLNYLA